MRDSLNLNGRDKIPRSVIFLAVFIFHIPVWVMGMNQEGENHAPSERAPSVVPLEDLSSKLVTVFCETTTDRYSSNGYIACMNGQTYLFTRQSVLLGAKKISFKTVSNVVLHPRGVELSEVSDIARLPLDEGIVGFKITDQVPMNSRISIPENNATTRTVKQLTGEIIGVGPDRVEVSARFISANSGSPVLNSKQEVLGITSYIMEPFQTVDKRGTPFGDRPRRFCYRIANARWKAVNWRIYNAKYGDFYKENAVFVGQVYEITSTLIKAPLRKIADESSFGRDLARWVKWSNGVVYKYGDSDANKRVFASEYSQGLKKLAKMCRVRAQNIRSFIDQHKLTGFLRKDLEAQIETLEDVIEGLNQISNFSQDYR